MTPEQYQIEASRTESTIEGIEGRDKTRLMSLIRLIHGMFGLNSESGEIADTLKRWLYYHQPLDEDNLKEEIGDLLWYVALLCNTLGIQMRDCMESNIRKLRKRFPEKFDNELAKEENRDRESEMEAVTQKFEEPNEILQIARDIADMLDSQDRKQALKMIEQRVNSLKDQN
jgi:NTP pyrophosphatase (non-canonical NTP hydrolase)